MIGNSPYPLLPPVIKVAQWYHLRWHKGTRFYEAILQQDLWGDWVLTRRWGRRGSKTGKSMAMPCASYEQGLQLLGEVIERRSNRGYTAVTELPESGQLIT
jgi:predicted DNA-binding WGR domain protein